MFISKRPAFQFEPFRGNAAKTNAPSSRTSGADTTTATADLNCCLQGSDTSTATADLNFCLQGSDTSSAGPDLGPCMGSDTSTATADLNFCLQGSDTATSFNGWNVGL